MQYLIDASVYVFRAHYSIPDDMVDPKGYPINALYGFCRFIGDFIEQVNPRRIGVLFDGSLSGSYRNEIYPEYKANREPAPPALKKQFEQCRRFVRLLGLMEAAYDMYEADDLIGTLVVAGRDRGIPSTIVSRDKDLAQLVSEKDIFWDFSGKGKVSYSDIPKYFGVWPEQIADFLALAGDSVDNIKGVPGIGRKTAIALLEKFGSLENIYNSLDLVKDMNLRGAKSVATKLDMHRDSAELSRKLTGIICDAPIDESDSLLFPKKPNIKELIDLFDEVNIGVSLRRQIERIDKLVKT